ncbi:MAG: carbohydrate ABC transporter permease [Treponema sp.]|nr:carbohydrate ABC transporter permease [Treponema sp.]
MNARTKQSRLRQEGAGYRVFTVFNYIIMGSVILVTAYPVYYVLIASISSPASLMVDYGLMWLPKTPLTLTAYKMVFRHPLILSGYRNTLFILIVGLGFNMVLTCLGAYFMCLKNSMFRRPVSLIIIFTMYFSGGLVPTYLNVQGLGMINSLWALIIPGAISTYNMLILRTAFYSIPDSLVEVARLDGASHFQILTKIFIPLSGATLAVMVLYYGVGHWNAWFFSSVFLQTPSKFPLQLVLRNILLLHQNVEFNAQAADDSVSALMAEIIKYALIVVSTAPILMLYPFLQRFFTKGVMIGAIKG